MIIDEDEDESILETYLRSRAAEFSRLFNGLTAIVLEIISTRGITRRGISRSLSSVENRNLPLILYIALVLALSTTLSITGLLNNKETSAPILDVEVHSGLWGRIQPFESSTKAFKVKNPTELPLTLELKTFKWSPIMAINDVQVSGDYGGDPLLSGEIRDVIIQIENLSSEDTILISLDIHIIGK